MKAIIKFVSVKIFCLIICFGCSKDSPIPCGGILNNLTVGLPNGSIRYDRVEVESFVSDRCKVGDNTVKQQERLHK